MVAGLEAPTSSGSHGHGLRFLNEDWNESISNGQPFTLRWNESVLSEKLDLRLFKVSYPEDGMVGYELVTKISDSVGNVSCEWIPDELENDLYALGLRVGDVDNGTWTVSPPWKPKSTTKQSLPKAVPIIIPVVCLLVLYAISLTICFTYRRRRRKRRQQEESRHGEAPAPLLPLRDESGRHPSVDTVVTIESVEEPDGSVKPGVWLVTQSPTGSPRAARESAALTELESVHLRM